MAIEEKIFQAKFQNEYEKLLVNLLYTSSALTHEIKPIFDAVDITAQQYNILRILRGAKQPLSTMQIRERMLDKMSDTSRIVDRLITKSLVKKAISKADRRLVSISLTSKGLTLLKKVDNKERKMFEPMYAISQKEAVMLNSLLDKLHSAW
jgi:DNA-binding MarR family transcriptional regulator